jgi:hypothetical protein
MSFLAFIVLGFPAMAARGAAITAAAQRERIEFMADPDGREVRKPCPLLVQLLAR